jgi:hypothetical protein
VPRFACAAKINFDEPMSGMPRPNYHTRTVSDDACITPLACVGHTVCRMWHGCMDDAMAPDVHQLNQKRSQSNSFEML